MPKEAKEEITKILGVEPIMINSALVSAQQRKRLYWVGKRKEDGKYETVKIDQPQDHKIYLRDILEDIPLCNPMWKPLDEKYIELVKERKKSLCIAWTYHKAFLRDYEKSSRQIVF